MIESQSSCLKNVKYDSSIVELKNSLPTAKSILIALPVGANIDKLAAALSLFLILEAQGKEVAVVSDDTITVGQSYLFGVDHIQKNLPSTQGGNLTLTLEGVASSNGTMPALEKLDWFAEAGNLNLVFHVVPGQIFQPAKIVPKYQGSSFNLIFVIGAAGLDSLGLIYRQNSSAFSGVHIINVDNINNASFGQTNVLDTNASSVCEIMTNLITDLSLSLDADSASNLLAGIFDATSNLENPQVTADTYMAVANCLRVGGKKPSVFAPAPQTLQSTPVVAQSAQFDWSVLMPKDTTIPTQEQVQDYTTPTIVNPPDAGGDHILPNAPSSPIQSGSPEERPAMEGVVSETVEPDWLTPKIFKGSSIG